jgi:nucleotide-binding universal stress UspA family protein
VFSQIRKILYTTDLSPNSACVLRQAVNSARKHDARLVALHVVNYLPPKTFILFEPYPTKEKIDQIAEEDAYAKKRIFKKIEMLWAKELKNAPGSEDILGELVIIPGDPTDQILKQARELSCDAISMGSHGKGFLMSAYLGSTTKKVLRRTNKPVLIIPLAEWHAIPTGYKPLRNFGTGFH